MLKKQKIETFLDLAAKINKKFEVEPILFGSLGLKMVTGYSGKIDDTDILVPAEFVKDKWKELVEFMKENGFELKDEEEHEFEKNSNKVAFADENDLAEVGIDKNSLKTTEKENARFKELTPEQYLTVYKEMLRDNYRQEKLGKNDKEKIAFIEDFLKKNSNKTKEYLDGWKRCQADFENYKKMQIESQREFVKYAGQNIVMQIIPVLDNFHMSTDHIPKDQKDGGWVVGIMHIQKQLENVLAENGVEEIPAKEGDKFDPAIHEAIEDSDKKEAAGDKVKKVLLKGYKMGNKIIRPAKVIVG